VRGWRDVVKPPLPSFQAPAPVRIAFPNGLIVFLQEDHELPLVSGSIWIRGGSREEPAGKVGLAAIYGSVWRTGGTADRTGDALDDFLEARAARVETSGTLTVTSLGWSCLKENLDEVFPVVLELLQKPEFREDKLALARRQMETGIARRNDDAGGIADREAQRIAYGADSPYARLTEYATVRSVTRDDLLAWHREFIHPNNMIVGVTGDFDAKAMEARLRKAFGSWKRGPAARQIKPPAHAPAPGVYVVDKEDVNQSTLRLVHGGIRRDNPDYYAIAMMNEILDGGFSGRLMTNVRTKKGLAYTVSGGVGSAYDHDGLATFGMRTKSDTTAAGIDALLAEIRSIRSAPPTADEMARARDSLLNSFIFRVDSRDERLYERMRYELYGYPLDLIERYRPAVEKVTAEDVLRVARKYVSEEKLAVVVVGRTKDFDRPLDAFGPVTKLDVTIPTPPAPAGTTGQP
jgi:zinc protease